MPQSPHNRALTTASGSPLEPESDMKRYFLPVTFALAIALPAAAGAAEQPPPRIIVVGQGESTVAPDMALLSLSVMREAASAREALTANNDAMAAVISAMKAA